MSPRGACVASIPAPQSTRSIVSSNFPKTERYSTSTSLQTPAGLAISYGFDMPLPSPPTTTTSSRRTHQPRSESMGWETHEVPIPRDVTHKPFVKAYDSATDTSSRFDSVLDAYANMYLDFAEDDDDNEAAQSDFHQVQEVQPQEPWDQRGKTGLYGGGGRGADDTETGWVSDYTTQMQVDGSRGSNGEEDLHYDDSEQDGKTDRYDSTTGRNDERRRSSDGTQSSYGPPTPVNANFDAMAAPYYDSAYRPIVAKVPTLPTPRSSRSSSSHTTNTTEGPRLARAQTINSNERTPPSPARPSRPNDRTASYESRAARPATADSRKTSPARPARASDPVYRAEQQHSTEHYRSASARVAPTRVISTDYPTSPPTPPARLHRKPSSKKAAVTSPTNPTISAPFSVPAHTEYDLPSHAGEHKRRKSVSQAFRGFGRSKKTPIISNPILPDGFVESLGMETFALTPGCAAPVHNVTGKPSRKEVEGIPPPRPRKQLAGAQPGTNRPNVTGASPPSHIRTPIDALRDAGSSTPSEFRDILHRLSQNSDISAAATLTSGEKDRQRYFKGLREDQSRQPTEVQANRSSDGQMNRGQSSGSTIREQREQVQAPSPPTHTFARRPSVAATIGKSARTYTPPPAVPKVVAPSLPSQNSQSSSDGFRDPWSKGTTPPSTFQNNSSDYISSAEVSPKISRDQYSDVDDREDYGNSEASDYSISPAIPSAISFKGYTTNGYPTSSPAQSTYQPFKSDTRSLDPRGHNAPMGDDMRQSVAGSVVWGGEQEVMSLPPLPPVPFKKPDASNYMGGFRNPFEAAPSRGPVRSGWQ
ncbi:hypothetical protein P7C70_g1227, partial [Phenoliferia sp. Uapishka_3]